VYGNEIKLLKGGYIIETGFSWSIDDQLKNYFSIVFNKDKFVNI
jgi:hypothetical protein